MNGRSFLTMVFLSAAVSIAASSCDGTGPDDVRMDLSGTWDARFEGTVTGQGTIQTDDISMELSQSGSSVAGTLRFSGLDLSFPISGQVDGNRFDYRSSATLDGCELRLEARTVIDLEWPPLQRRSDAVFLRRNGHRTGRGHESKLTRTPRPRFFRETAPC